MDNTLYNLVVPKLRAVRDESGSAATIHDAASHLLVITSAHTNAVYWERVGNTEKFLEQLKMRDDRLKVAEKWMLDIARRL